MTKLSCQAVGLIDLNPLQVSHKGSKTPESQLSTSRVAQLAFPLLASMSDAPWVELVWREAPATLLVVTCRLGKRKASERADEVPQDVQHSKRAALEASGRANSAEAARSHPADSQADADIRGQTSNQRKRPHTDATQHNALQPGTATDQGFKRFQPQPSGADASEQCRDLAQRHELSVLQLAFVWLVQKIKHLQAAV